jgi:hypothetical protein
VGCRDIENDLTPCIAVTSRARNSAQMASNSILLNEACMSKTSQRKQDRLFRLKKVREAAKAEKSFPFKSASKEEINTYWKAVSEIQ